MSCIVRKNGGMVRVIEPPEWDAGTVDECKEWIEESEYKIIQDLST